MPPRTLDPTTAASNQAVLRVTRSEYARYRSSNTMERCFEHASTFLPVQWAFLQPFAKGYKWVCFQEKFLYGDLNPTVVVNASTGVVATYTDLDHTQQNPYPVIKVHHEKLRLLPQPASDGDVFAAVSVYQRHIDSTALKHWHDFSPTIVDCVVRDPQRCAFAKAKIPPVEWTALRLGVSQLKDSTRPGLYLIRLPESVRAELAASHD